MYSLNILNGLLVCNVIDTWAIGWRLLWLYSIGYCTYYFL